MSRTKGAKNKAKPAGKPPKAAKADKPAKAAAAAAPEAVTLRLTPGTSLKSLLSTCRGIKEKVDGMVGKLREEIAFHVAKKHLHKGAFADLRRLDKMEGEKAAEHWHTLVGYMESSGVMAKIEAVGRLPLGDDAEGESEKAGEGEGPKAETPPAKPAAAAKPGPDAPGTGDAKVSRPHFGARPGAGVSGTQLRPAADKTH